MPRKTGFTEEFHPDSIPAIFQIIDKIGKKLDRMERRTTQAAGLTPSQFAVLSSLWLQDGSAFKDLAAVHWCTRPTMTGIVDTLERKGLVVRKPNPDDRRSLLVCLTDRGRAMQKKAKAMKTMFQNCCEGLNASETGKLSRLLQKLDESLS